MRIISCLESTIPENRSEEIIYLSQYSNPRKKDIGYFGLSFREKVRRAHISPSDSAWDFATFALSIAAIDKLIPRNESPDGWTRVIDAEIHLYSPSIWSEIKDELQRLLRFLTGDFWLLDFRPDGSKPPQPTPVFRDADCISLLSGGVDSLIGGIDLTEQGKKPLFVSHKVRGSTSAQTEYALRLNAEKRHFQWSFEAKLDGYRENSTRGRSMVFYAFAAVASSVIIPAQNQTIDVYIPENGFISLNIPLSPARFGSLSTKTTHPVYMDGLQSLWRKLNIPLTLKFPYRFKTKGEMILECLNSDLLQELIATSVSCGKYIRHYEHCGVCVPCLVRRGSFYKSDLEDSTKYRKDIQTELNDNISVAATAYLRMNSKGVRSVIGSELNFAWRNEKALYESVFSRGLTEIYELLHFYGRV